MFLLTHSFPIAMRRLLGLILLLDACTAIAQAATVGDVQIQTPNLPPRQSAPQTTGDYGTQGSQGNYGTQGSQGNYGTQGSQGNYGTQGSQGNYGTQGSQGGYDPQGSQGGYGIQTPKSALGSRMQPQAAYGPQGAQGGYGAQGNSGTTGSVPTRPSSEGPCRVEVAPDRQTLTFVGVTDALPRHFLPLGEFRAQQVIHSPDGRWAVAFVKLRGQAQFAMLTLDLTTCKEQHSVDLTQAGEDATFEADNVTVRFGGKEQTLPLADKRVR